MALVEIASLDPLIVRGEDGISVTSAMVGQDGHLRFSLSNDTQVDAGNVAAAGALTFIDNNDGTVSFIGSGAVDNGDGTVTIGA